MLRTDPALHAEFTRYWPAFDDGDTWSLVGKAIHRLREECGVPP